MIFEHTHEQVGTEDKCETRRLARPGDYASRRHYPLHMIEAKGLTIDKSYTRDRAWVIGCASRLNKKGQRYYTWKNGLLWPKHTYGVQPGRKMASLYQIRFTILSLENLQEIDEVSILNEGCRDLHDFRTLWDSIQTERVHMWDFNPLVWALTFKLVKERETDVTSEAVSGGLQQEAASTRSRRVGVV